MKCDRCGRENYDESYYCRNCGAELEHSGINTELTRFSKPNYLNQYQSSSTTYQDYNKYSQQKNKSDELNINKQQYRYDNTSTDNRQYEYNNTHTDNKQYWNDNSFTDNKQYNNTYADNKQYGYDNSFTDNNNNSFTDNQQSSYNNASADNQQSGYNNTSNDNKTFEYYSTPPTSKFDYDNYNAHREPSKFDTTRAKVLKINGVLSIVGFFVFLILAISFEYFSYNSLPSFIGGSSASIESTEPVTEPEDYTAKLSYGLHTITDSSGEHLEASYSVPEGYEYEYSGSNGLALFNRNVNDTEVSFSTSFFKGELQKEINYYSGLDGENGKTFNMEVIDTDLGEMTLITLTRADTTTVYHAYVKCDNKYYFHISLSNVPEDYKSEAYKLINLVMQDTTIEFIDDEN